MGGSQSGPKVITVETGHGDTDVTVSQDFVNYITNKSDNGEDNDQSSADDYTSEPPRAQDLLRGMTTVDNQWHDLYIKEQLKNKEYKSVTDKEFEEVSFNVKKQLNESKVGQSASVCEDMKEKILSCYNKNTNRMLNCSNEVYEYTLCVEKARKSLLVQTLPVSTSE